MNFAEAPPMTSVPGPLNWWMVCWTVGLPVTSITRSRRGSSRSSSTFVATGMLRRRARSRPGAHGLTSHTPAMVTLVSPTNISRRARPPVPAPTMTTLVMVPARPAFPARRRARARGVLALAPRSRPGTGPATASEGLCLALRGRQILERGVFGNEGQIHAAGRPVPLLADDDLGDLLPFLRLQPVPLRPVHEHDEIGILLQGPRFAQVGALRLLVLALSRL